MKLNYFKEIKFLPAIKALLKELNVPVNYISDEPTTAQEILEYTYKDNETFRLIQDVYFVGMVDDAAFEGNESFDHTKIKSDYAGILFFGVELAKRENDLLPTRSQLADIARAFNREFHFTPVVIVFKYANDKEEFISFANTERIKYKQEWREGEKAGKVALLRDISIEKPHRGHEDIINQLKITTSGKKAIRSFDELYKYWQEVFSVNILSKKFYQELSNWYFWAVNNVCFPGEPSFANTGIADQDKLNNLIHEHNAKNVIRLLTRVLFTWFIKEKGLIPKELFDLTSLQEDMLNDINPYHEEGTLFNTANKKSIYYKAILQNLFFASLNCPISADGSDTRQRGFRGNESYGKHRGVDHLMRYEKHFKEPTKFLKMMNLTVPFLNGGLFECLDDKLNNTYIDGFSDQMTKGEKLIVPDYLFFGLDEKIDLSAEYGSKNKKHKEAAVKGLINILDSYKFTIAENTPIEEDVALDPELLGKVFENLLASYNPETKTTARKQTGSFYTPREIVNYMVDESLIAYLKNKILKEDENIFVEIGEIQTNLFGNKGKSGQLIFQVNPTSSEFKNNETILDDLLHQLMSYNPGNPFGGYPQTTQRILFHIDKCKILDPACGSGAFPMGILQKMVHVLQKLDPDNAIWQDIQLQKAVDESQQAFQLSTKEEREQRLLEINNAFDESINNPDYARKLFLIENCIYGVDIQPIATQISKLRFFISLVVDQKNNTDTASNFGIRPLPNLETKFVTANTLIGIEKPSAQTSMEDTETIVALKTELKQVRRKVFNAKTPKTKRKHREQDEILRNKISTELKKTGWRNETADKLSSWDPYDQNASASFFDSEWMFDISEGFDVVIGNPPYVQLQANAGALANVYQNENFETFGRTGDIYALFYENGLNLLCTNGLLCFITSNKWMRAKYGERLRGFLADKNPLLLLDLGPNVFETATVDTNILLVENAINTDSLQTITLLDHKQIDYKNEFSTMEISKDIWSILSKKFQVIKKSIELKGQSLSKWNVNINRGILTGLNEAFIIENDKRNELIEGNKQAVDLIKPILRGKDIDRYRHKWKELWLINTHNGLKNKNSGISIDEYPSIKEHLGQYKVKLEKRQDKGDTFYNLRSCAYLDDFEKPKIIYQEMVQESSFYYDKDNHFFCNDTGRIITGVHLEYLTALLNSKLFFFAVKFYYGGGALGSTGVRMKHTFFENFPAIKPTENSLLPFFTLLIQESKIIGSPTKIFESIVDGCVFNLYFPDHMIEKEIDVLEYVEGDIKKAMKGGDFDNLSDIDKGKVIEQLQLIWTHPDNEVRNRIKLFAVRSPDILKPILES